MSKSTTKPHRPDSGGEQPPTRPYPIGKRSMSVLGVLLFGMGSIAFLHLCASPAAAGSFAALYLFANDGKVSGRMSGDVKMRNGRSRAMAFPALVRNAYTTAVRNSFGSLSAAFRGLSAANIAAWNAFSYKKSDRFANDINVKGKMAYVGLNQNLVDVGQATIAAPPNFVGTFDQTLGAATFVSAGTLTYVASAYNAANKYIVFATSPQSAGVTRPGKSKFRIIAVSPTITGGSADISAGYHAKYGNPPVGSKVFVYTVAVDKNTGEKGAGSNIISGIAT